MRTKVPQLAESGFLLDDAIDLKTGGDLMLLIEPDKRSSKWAVKLAYSEKPEETFYVPANLYLLGLMNTADRSLAVVDYALRRRFAFKTLAPGFEADTFSGIGYHASRMHNDYTRTPPRDAATTKCGPARREHVARDAIRRGPHIQNARATCRFRGPSMHS